jgi:hypothetical protein
MPLVVEARSPKADSGGKMGVVGNCPLLAYVVAEPLQ